MLLYLILKSVKEKSPLLWIVEVKHSIQNETTLKQRRFNVDATCRIDVDTTYINLAIKKLTYIYNALLKMCPFIRSTL